MANIKRKFPKEDLQELVDMNVGDTYKQYQLMENEIEDTSRWSVNYGLTFKVDDKFYSVGYSVGATEQQDESPFEYDPDEIECFEVEPVEVMKVTYKAKAAV